MERGDKNKSTLLRGGSFAGASAFKANKQVARGESPPMYGRRSPGLGESGLGESQNNKSPPLMIPIMFINRPLSRLESGRSSSSFGLNKGLLVPPGVSYLDSKPNASNAGVVVLVIIDDGFKLTPRVNLTSDGQYVFLDPTSHADVSGLFTGPLATLNNEYFGGTPAHYVDFYFVHGDGGNPGSREQVGNSSEQRGSSKSIGEQTSRKASDDSQLDFKTCSGGVVATWRIYRRYDCIHLCEHVVLHTKDPPTTLGINEFVRNATVQLRMLNLFFYRSDKKKRSVGVPIQQNKARCCYCCRCFREEHVSFFGGILITILGVYFLSIAVIDNFLMHHLSYRVYRWTLAGGIAFSPIGLYAQPNQKLLTYLFLLPQQRIIPWELEKQELNVVTQRGKKANRWELLPFVIIIIICVTQKIGQFIFAFLDPDNIIHDLGNFKFVASCFLGFNTALFAYKKLTECWSQTSLKRLCRRSMPIRQYDDDLWEGIEKTLFEIMQPIYSGMDPGVTQNCIDELFKRGCTNGGIDPRCVVHHLLAIFTGHNFIAVNPEGNLVPAFALGYRVSPQIVIDCIKKFIPECIILLCEHYVKLKQDFPEKENPILHEFINDQMNEIISIREKNERDQAKAGKVDVNQLRHILRQHNIGWFIKSPNTLDSATSNRLTATDDSQKCVQLSSLPEGRDRGFNAQSIWLKIRLKNLQIEFLENFQGIVMPSEFGENKTNPEKKTVLDTARLDPYFVKNNTLWDSVITARADQAKELVHRHLIQMGQLVETMWMSWRPESWKKGEIFNHTLYDQYYEDYFSERNSGGGYSLQTLREPLLSYIISKTMIDGLKESVSGTRPRELFSTYNYVMRILLGPISFMKSRSFASKVGLGEERGVGKSLSTKNTIDSENEQKGQVESCDIEINPTRLTDAETLYKEKKALYEFLWGTLELDESEDYVLNQSWDHLIDKFNIARLTRSEWTEISTKVEDFIDTAKNKMADGLAFIYREQVSAYMEFSKGINSTTFKPFLCLLNKFRPRSPAELLIHSKETMGLIAAKMPPFNKAWKIHCCCRLWMAIIALILLVLSLLGNIYYGVVFEQKLFGLNQSSGEGAAAPPQLWPELVVEYGTQIIGVLPWAWLNYHTYYHIFEHFLLGCSPRSDQIYIVETKGSCDKITDMCKKHTGSFVCSVVNLLISNFFLGVMAYSTPFLWSWLRLGIAISTGLSSFASKFIAQYETVVVVGKTCSNTCCWSSSETVRRDGYFQLADPAAD